MWGYVGAAACALDCGAVHPADAADREADKHPSDCSRGLSAIETHVCPYTFSDHIQTQEQQ